MPQLSLSVGRTQHLLPHVLAALIALSVGAAAHDPDPGFRTGAPIHGEASP
jgi:hypothetical protein